MRALGLFRLAGLGLEAVDEGLQVGPLPALLLEGGLDRARFMARCFSKAE
jgi:hypothetical protein